MKIGDIVYLIYDYRSYDPACSVWQIEILSDFAEVGKPTYVRKQQACQGKYLKQYDIYKGWEPYQQRNGRDIYRVAKANLYSTWDEAFAQLQKNLECYFAQAEQQIKTLREEINSKEKALASSIKSLKDLKQNKLKNFSLIQDTYVSPFTQEKK